MSIQAVSWVMTHSQAKLGARLVLIAIANHADANGEHAYPPIAMIAAEAGMSERQAQRCIAALKRLGEVDVAGVGGRGRTNAFCLPRMGGKLSPFNTPEPEPVKGDNSGANGDISDIVSAIERVTFRAEKGDKSGQKGCQKCHPNLKRTVREPRGPPPTVPPPPGGDGDVVEQQAASKAKANGTTTGRGTRLPADWRPDAGDCEFAAGLGLDPEALADEFRDYWHSRPGSGGLKLDWHGTWRNRCREVAGRRRGVFAGGGSSRPGEIAAALRAIQARGRLE